ncbi:hypothetical protein NDU88_004267 [Pleurodeles waltl]|uniref:Uncharacterized protein n=1 Tax=Pleurodeles waltl TaxID=8319 RepID=A0AAV7MUZ7_PLEWA|nr:hypothetical protein NDU88_004267 [Pleurodeles waltl]
MLGRGAQTAHNNVGVTCGEERDPILGLRPRRIQTTVRGQRKGPPRVPRPLTRAAASPVAWPEDAAASPAAQPGGAAAARGVTISVLFSKSSIACN